MNLRWWQGGGGAVAKTPRRLSRLSSSISPKHPSQHHSQHRWQHNTQRNKWGAALKPITALLLLAVLALQLYFAARVALMTVVNPLSTTYERSELWRVWPAKPWQQAWVSLEAISAKLQQAVIAAEDANFADHSGVEWEAMEKAWDRNFRAQVEADLLTQKLQERAGKTSSKTSKNRSPKAPRIVGGSTITQQLAKNLFLSGERNLVRKGQEIIITFMLEALLSKPRILEIYLNNVEWGEGVFGVQAAAQHYFKTDAAKLSARQAARLAVMLPAPKRFEKRFNSRYLNHRANVLAARMEGVDLP
jgi:monofunctional glycosyltransferase